MKDDFTKGILLDLRRRFVDMAPKLTFTYFDAAGPAEPVRMALAMTRQPWEDKRISREEFAVLKPCKCLDDVV